MSALSPDSSILVVLLGSLGDVARGLCVVPQVKRQLPNARVSWLVEPKCEELVRLQRGIDHTIVFRRGHGIRAMLELRKTLLGMHFDVCLDLQRHLKSGFLSWCSGAKRRVGFSARDSKEGNWLFNNEHIPTLGENISKMDHYARFLSHLGITQPSTFRWDLNEGALAQSAYSVGSTPYVVCVLGSSWVSKDWIAEGYLKLCQQLTTQYVLNVILVGSRREELLAGQIVAALGTERITNTTGKTTVTELCAIIARARFAIGPDSGPGHIASALGIPYISLFGATSPLRTAPYGMSALVVQSPIGCSPCYRRVCPGLDRLCMRLISVQEVMAKVGQVMQEGYS